MANLPMDKPVSIASRRGRRIALYVVVALGILITAAIYVKYREALDFPRQGPGAWYPAAPSPIARALGPGVVIGKRLYVFGGFHTRPLNVTRRVDVYDPTIDKWARMANMPIANTHIATAVDGDTAWLAGGFLGDHPGRATGSVYKYHAPTDRWTIATPLPKPRAAGTLVRLGRNLHFFGGFSFDRNTTYGDHWVLPIDGEQKWTLRAPFPKARGHHAAVVLDGKIYAIGGSFNHDDDRRDVVYVHRYDPRSDQWAEVAPLPFALSHIESSTLVWNKRIYVFGGRSDHRSSFFRHLLQPQPVQRRFAMPDVTAYDPADDSWIPQQELPVGLMIPIVVQIDGRIIVTNGSTFYTYFPQSSTYVGCFPLISRPAKEQIPC